MDSDKKKKIEEIRKNYQEKIKALKQERDEVINKAISFLEKKKIEEIRKNL